MALLPVTKQSLVSLSFENVIFQYKNTINTSNKNETRQSRRLSSAVFNSCQMIINLR